MTTVVLDASALVAMLRGERGAAKVAAAIADAHIGAVACAEVVGHFVGAGMPADRIDTVLGSLPMTVVPLDAALAQAAGRLCGTIDGAALSLGDRCSIALAARDRLPLWTGNIACRPVADTLGVKLVTIR